MRLKLITSLLILGSIIIIFILFVFSKVFLIKRHPKASFVLLVIAASSLILFTIYILIFTIIHSN